jgi:hypothetical protein
MKEESPMTTTEYPATETEMASWLTELIYEADEEQGSITAPAPAVQTFGEHGLMTHNEGLVISFPTGAEYQVTIVQSKDAEPEAGGNPYDLGPEELAEVSRHLRVDHHYPDLMFAGLDPAVVHDQMYPDCSFPYGGSDPTA